MSPLKRLSTHAHLSRRRTVYLHAKEAMVAGVIRLQDPKVPPKTRRYLPHWAWICLLGI
jgi:hypothetical protein